MTAQPKPRTIAALIRLYRRENGIAPEVRVSPDGTVTLAPPMGQPEPRNAYERWKAAQQ